MPSLNKKDVERLLEHYDDNPRDALLTCLRIVQSNQMLTWQEAIEQLDESWNKEALLNLNIQACDGLAQHLVEMRSL